MPLTNCDDQFFNNIPARPEMSQCDDEQSTLDRSPSKEEIFIRKLDDYPLLIRLANQEDITLESLTSVLGVKHRASVLKIVRRYFRQLQRQFDQQNLN
ncbi:MAG TPA: hypothetical protein PLN21_02380 [Gemmatales bacterium]|nr:hypothetical protein [Gemmatales bacterium]